LNTHLPAAPWPVKPVRKSRLADAKPRPAGGRRQPRLADIRPVEDKNDFAHSPGIWLCALKAIPIRFEKAG
jgi:hypothetical protein